MSITILSGRDIEQELSTTKAKAIFQEYMPSYGTMHSTSTTED